MEQFEQSPHEDRCIEKGSLVGLTQKQTIVIILTMWMMKIAIKGRSIPRQIRSACVLWWGGGGESQCWLVRLVRWAACERERACVRERVSETMADRDASFNLEGHDTLQCNMHSANPT